MLDCEKGTLQEGLHAIIRRRMTEASEGHAHERTLLGEELDWSALARSFCSADPTPDKRWAVWIVESYLDRGINSLEDLGRVTDGLKKYDYLLREGKLKGDAVYERFPKRCKKVDETNLDSFNGLLGCESMHVRDEYHRGWVQYEEVEGWWVVKPGSPLKCLCSGCPRPGLDELLKRHQKELRVFRRREEEKIPLAEMGTRMIYSSADYLLVRLMNKDAAMHWGKGTRWCTSAKDGCAFDEYDRQGPLYVIVDGRTGDKYQLHAATNQYMNARDEEVDAEMLITRFPLAFERQFLFGTLAEIRIRDPEAPEGRLVKTEVIKPPDQLTGEDVAMMKRYARERNMALRLSSGAKIAVKDGEPVLSVEISALPPSFELPLFQMADALVIREPFNGSLRGVSMPNLRSLTLHDKYDQSLEGVDLANLTRLSTLTGSEKLLTGAHLPSLETLRIGSLSVLRVSDLRNPDLPKLREVLYRMSMTTGRARPPRVDPPVLRELKGEFPGVKFVQMQLGE